MLGNSLLGSSASKLLVAAIARVDDAVAQENKDIAGRSVDRDLIVGCVGEHSQRQSGSLDHVRVALATMDGPRQAGIGHAHDLLLVIPERATQNDVVRFQASLVKRAV